MSRPRAAMRKIREALRLCLAEGLTASKAHPARSGHGAPSIDLCPWPDILRQMALAGVVSKGLL